MRLILAAAGGSIHRHQLPDELLPLRQRLASAVAMWALRPLILGSVDPIQSHQRRHDRDRVEPCGSAVQQCRRQADLAGGPDRRCARRRISRSDSRADRTAARWCATRSAVRLHGAHRAGRRRRLHRADRLGGAARLRTVGRPAHGDRSPPRGSPPRSNASPTHDDARQRRHVPSLRALLAWGSG